MASVELALADAIAEQLVQLLHVPAKRQYQLIVEREQLGESLHVYVFPNSDALEVVDGEGNEEIVEINVVVQQGVLASNVEEVDGCVELLRRIKALFGENGALRDAELAGCTFTGLINAPLWNPDRLLNNREFLSVLTLSYRTDQ